MYSHPGECEFPSVCFEVSLLFTDGLLLPPMVMATVCMCFLFCFIIIIFTVLIKQKIALHFLWISEIRCRSYPNLLFLLHYLCLNSEERIIFNLEVVTVR